MNEWVRLDAFLLLSLRCIWHLFRMAKCCHPSSSMLCTQKANNCLKQVNQKWMEEKQTVHLVKKRRKQRWRWQRFQQVLHYITFQLQCWVSEWCAEKKLYFHVLSRSIFSCVTWDCTLHAAHTACQFVSSAHGGVWGCCIFYQFIAYIGTIHHWIHIIIAMN